MDFHEMWVVGRLWTRKRVDYDEFWSFRLGLVVRVKVGR